MMLDITESAGEYRVRMYILLLIERAGFSFNDGKFYHARFYSYIYILSKANIKRLLRVRGLPFSTYAPRGGGGVQVSYTFPLRIKCKKDGRGSR